MTQVYTGQTSDLLSGNPIPECNIELIDEGSIAKTDFNGGFVLKTGKVPEKSPIRFLKNTLLWEGSLNASLSIYSSNGQLVHQETSLQETGQYILPRLPGGMYLLYVEQPSSSEAFRLFSDGLQTQLVDDRAPKEQFGTNDETIDTLLVEKEGYYPRKIAISERSTHLNVKMLSGELDELHYLNELIDPIAFDVLSSSPSRNNFGGVKSVKILYDIRDDLVYYMNSKRYNLHVEFAEQVLKYPGSNYEFNVIQYKEGKSRYLYPANLNYHESQDRYVLHFVASNEVACHNIEVIFNKIKETSYIGDKLFFYSIKPEWDACTGVKKIDSETLFEGQNYQALNLTENYGYLRKIDIDKLEDEYLGRNDLILTNGIPNDLSVVAGIITTEFQTPLSHINVLSHSRNTPNMALRDGWESLKLNKLLDELVYLKVTADDFTIRKATLEEAEAFWEKSRPQHTTVLEPDLNSSELIDMEDASITDLSRIGGKAANFGEIVNSGTQAKPIPVPEMAFAIPFYYYDQHIKTNGIGEFIAQLLNDKKFKEDPAYRKSKLEELQDRIKAAPISKDLVNQVEKRINYFKDFESFRFRSSTNAEDLEGFSGAGLYTSKSAKKNHATKTIEVAIKKVWASLWGWRAFEERDYFKIDHAGCAMGILVHRSFPNEDANGVLVTKNLYNGNRGFTVNVQFKDYSIVFPEPGVLHDQIMIIGWSLQPGEDFTIEYLSFSNLEELNGARVMTDRELKTLAAYTENVRDHFYYDLEHSCECEIKHFGVDIEFKVDSSVSPRKIYIKQARLYK